MPRTPYHPHRALELEKIRAAWPEIRDEGAWPWPPCARSRPPTRTMTRGFNSFFKYGWKRFYLKWYEARHPSAEVLCPRTVELAARPRRA
ncbi:aspartyl/asparaginyl beta-hydroxylase domain-containing protein [Cupriavidus basilensis]